LVHPGVDRAAFRPWDNKGLYGRPSVLFLLRGPGYSWKGTNLFWQAITQVHHVYPEMKLLILANDEAADPQIAVPHLVFRAPNDDEFSRIVSAADIFVFPSLFEGFGLPPLEAMACGTAVIATDNGGVSDYARHGLNCLLVPPGQVEALAGAILQLLQDHELRARICANGLDTAAAWPWYRLYDEMHQLVPALTGARP
jgi:glycosyltransferase involved in cell wall biosynthesis